MQPNANIAKAPHPDAITRDAEAAAAKKTLMKRLKTNSMLNSFSKIASFAAGPILGFGLVNALVASFGSGAVAGTAGAAAVATAGAVAIPMLIIGAVIAGAAAIADYAASRSWQSNSIDTQEVTAQSNARNLVRELEAHNLCLTSKDNVVKEPCHQRRDGKTWVDATRPQNTQQEAAR